MLALCAAPFTTDHHSTRLDFHFKWPSHFAGEFFSPLVCLSTRMPPRRDARNRGGLLELDSVRKAFRVEDGVRAWRPLLWRVGRIRRTVVDMPRGVTLLPGGLVPSTSGKDKSQPCAPTLSITGICAHLEFHPLQYAALYEKHVYDSTPSVRSDKVQYTYNTVEPLMWFHTMKAMLNLYY